MKKIYLEIAIFSIPILLAFCFSIGSYVYAYQRINWNHKLIKPLEINEREDFDLLLLGSSRAAKIVDTYNFDQDKLKVKSLHTTGGGLLFQELYLNSFFNKKNTAQNVVFFIDPFVLYTSKWDIPNVGRLQRFDFDFFLEVVEKMGIQWAYDYLGIYKKFRKDTALPVKEFEEKKLDSVDSLAVIARIRMLYGIRGAIDYPNQKQRLLDNIKLTLEQNKGSHFVFCIPPTLLGEKEQFKEELIVFLEEVKSTYNIPYYDYSLIYNDVSTYHYFTDHDHLNNEGVNVFLKNISSHYYKNKIGFKSHI